MAPTEEIVYPPGYQTYVNVERTTQVLEGAARPGHFQGVTTIVAKLFNVFNRRAPISARKMPSRPP